MTAVLDLMVTAPGDSPVVISETAGADPVTDLTVVVGGGIRGPAGVVIISQNDSTPPPGTPPGVVVYRRI